MTEGCTTPGGFCVVMGMGVNVNTPEFPPELRDIAASLYLASGRKWDIGAFSARLIESLDKMYALWLKDPEAFLEEYRARCATVGCDVTYTRSDTVYNARARRHRRGLCAHRGARRGARDHTLRRGQREKKD